LQEKYFADVLTAVSGDAGELASKNLCDEHTPTTTPKIVDNVAATKP